MYIQGGKIRVNINSGAYTGKYIGAATLAHEITHALQEYSKELYGEFTDFITDEVLGAEELARLVNIQLNLEPNLSPGEALDEVIANGCAKMLLNNEAIQKMAEQNRSLFGWIKDKINEITGNIDKAYDEIDLNDNLDVYQAARAFQRSEAEIRERWNKMLEIANENKRAEQIMGKKISVEGGRVQNMAIDKDSNVIVDGDVKADDVYSLLVDLENGKIKNTDFTFAIWKHTPQVYIDYAKYGDRSFVMNADKARNAMVPGDNHKHGLGSEGLMRVILNLYRPDYIIEEHTKKNEGHHAAVFMNDNGDVVAAVELRNWRNGSGAVAGEEGYYNSLITAYDELLPWMKKEFKTFDEYVDSLFKSPNKVVYDKAEHGEYEAPEDVALSGSLLRLLSGTSSATSIADISIKSKSQNQKFQMLVPVEETDKLVAVHNKSVNGLKRMLQRGGVPFPSIAIKKAGAPHEGFGDVSIVFPRSTIDPQVNRQNRLYSNDAWTPTEPRVEYDVGDMWRYQKKIRQMVGDKVYDALRGSSYLEEDEVAKRLQYANGDVVEAMKNQSALKYAYLKSIGQEPQVQTTAETLDNFHKYKNDQLLAVFDALTEDEIEGLKWDDDKAMQKVADILNEHFRENYAPESARLKLLEKPLYDIEDINPRIIQDAYRKYKDAGKTIRTVADEAALDRELRSNTEIENDKGYREWLADMFKDLIQDEGIRNNKDLFTSSGSRRSFKALHNPATLENIVAQMQKEQERGNGLFGVNLRGAATKTYNTVEEMRAESGKLLGTHIADDVYDSYMEGFNNRLHELVDRVVKNKDSWSASDSAREILLETLRDAKSKAQMNSLLRKEAQWINYSEGVVDDLWALRNDVQNMPAPYFEAKPRRIVYPGEALAYIVPDNADSDVMKELEDRGYNVLTYKAGDEQDRLAKLNSVEKAKFQKLGVSETAEEQQAKKDSLDNLKAENKILQARAEYWKAQTRPTKERTVRQQDTDRLANELLKKYESRADKAEVKAALKELGDWLVQTEDLDYDTLKAKAEAIAEDIISDNYALLDNSQQEQLDRLKDYLKSNPVNLSASDWRDTGDEGFRKKYGRYFTVRENGRTIDSLWGEMAAMFGEGVFVHQKAIYRLSHSAAYDIIKKWEKCTCKSLCHTKLCSRENI